MELRRSKHLLTVLIGLVCLSFSSIAQAKLAVVCTVVGEDGSSRLEVFDPHSGNNITHMYTAGVQAGTEYRALAGGTFTFVTIKSQVIIAAWDSVNDKAYARNYALTETDATFGFDTVKIGEYQSVDIAAGQFDDDALDEYVMAVDINSPYWQEWGGRVRLGDETGWLLECNLMDDRYFTGIAVGQYDDDSYDEIVVSAYSASDNHSGSVHLYDHMLGGLPQQNPIFSSPTHGAWHDQMPYSDLATGDYDGDGLSETYVTVDRYDLGRSSTAYIFDDPPDNGSDWDVLSPLMKQDGQNTYPFDGRPTKLATLNTDNDSACEMVLCRTGWWGYPGFEDEEAEIRLQDDNSTGGGYGMCLIPGGNTGNLMDDISHFTSITTADLNGDGIDEMIVGWVHKGTVYNDNASILESAIRIYQWDPTAPDPYGPGLGAWVDRHGVAGPNIAGTITDVAVIDLAPGQPQTCWDVSDMGYNLQTDLDHSCYVNWGDFAIFASQWLDPNCGTPSDFDGSCLVDWGDFSIFTGTWLDCNDPQNPQCQPNWKIPAFFGAQGGGAESIGGRGGRIIEVTNLNDAGPGSFRAACVASGSRIVVFRVAGIIQIDDRISISKPYITIAGQTAPGGGILVKGNEISITTHDVIVRFIRVRTGRRDEFGYQSGDAIGLGSSCHNVMIDHCSASWSNDENIQIWSSINASHNVTFSWNMIAEGLTYNHASCGLIVGSDYDAFGIHDISVHHNAFMHGNNRFPLVKCRDARIINNLMYNWDWWPTGTAGGIKVDIIGNKYKMGPSTPVSGYSTYEVWVRDRGWQSPDDGCQGFASIYIRGNIGPHQDDPDGDNWPMLLETDRVHTPLGHPPDRATHERSEPMAGSTHPITVHPVSDLENMILADVGASRRLDENGNWVSNRDAVDERLINEYINGTGQIPNDENAVGGYPTIDPGTPYQDSDHDGMPDQWENQHGLEPNDDSDGPRDADGDGYTNIEEFLNGTDPHTKNNG